LKNWQTKQRALKSQLRGKPLFAKLLFLQRVAFFVALLRLKIQFKDVYVLFAEL